MDEKICCLILSDDPKEVEIGWSMVCSKHQFEFEGWIPACMVLAVCKSISDAYKNLRFNVHYSTKKTEFWCELIFQNPYAFDSGTVATNYLRVEGSITKLVKLFEQIRKVKTTRQVENWLEKKIPRLFIKMLPKEYEGHPKTKPSKVIFELDRKRL